MKRFYLTIIFSLVVVGLYHLINVPFFNLSITKATREALFAIRNDPEHDPTVELFNIGKLTPSELEEKIDYMLVARPKKIGINPCHWNVIPQALIKKYQSDSRIVFANCKNDGPGSLSQINSEDDGVTHFKSDSPNYFELKLTGFAGRGNGVERIHYGAEDHRFFFRKELSETTFWFPSDIENKTILIGYMGDYLTDSVYNFKNCRITPLNHYYGHADALPDMYDTEISGHILRTINTNDFINDVNQVVRVLIILAFSLLNVAVLTYAKTKWTLVNLTIATVLFLAQTAAGSLLIVLMFDARYYLSLDELPLVLLITTIFTVILNLIEKVPPSTSSKQPEL